MQLQSCLVLIILLANLRRSVTIGGSRIFLEGVTLGTRASEALGGGSGLITERNFLVQWRRRDLARGRAQNDIKITSHAHNNNMK